jgi:hypothetical protein
MHKQTANLSCFQKSAYYSGIKIFVYLLAPSLMKKKAQFKEKLKKYLNTHSFYCSEIPDVEKHSQSY